MVQEIYLLKNTGKATFVDITSSNARSTLHSEYGKALFKQQQDTRNHTIEHISGLSSVDMKKFPLVDILGVTAFHTTDRTITFGTLRVVTSNDYPLVAGLIDTHIHTHFPTHSFNFPPTCSKKASESVTGANKNAWIAQNKSFTATAPTRKNAQIQRPKITLP